MQYTWRCWNCTLREILGKQEGLIARDCTPQITAPYTIFIQIWLPDPISNYKSTCISLTLHPKCNAILCLGMVPQIVGVFWEYTYTQQSLESMTTVYVVKTLCNLEEALSCTTSWKSGHCKVLISQTASKWCQQNNSVQYYTSQTKSVLKAASLQACYTITIAIVVLNAISIQAVFCLHKDIGGLSSHHNVKHVSMWIRHLF